MGDKLSRIALTAATFLLPTAFLLAQTPKLSFSAPKAVNVPSGTASHIVGIGDVNGDGKTDFLSYGGLFFGNGTGGFTNANTDETALVDYGSPIPLSLLDLNGDGKLDAIQTIPGQYDPNHCDDTNGTINIFIGDGHGHFNAHPTGIVLTPSVSFSIVTGDFNHDGRPDFAFASDGSTNPCEAVPSGITVYLNKGDGTFAEGQNINVIPDDLVTGDFNGDGKLDLAYYGSPFYAGGKVISVLSGNGDGSFRTGPKYTLDAQPFGLLPPT